MKRLNLTIIALCATLTMMAQGMAFEPEGTTLEQAAAKAKAEKKLIFLDCYTQWCGPCKKMAAEIFPMEKVGAYMNPKFINLKIDMEGDYGTPLAKKLQISAYPTFVIFNSNAEEIGRIVGGSNADDFIKRVGEKSQDNSSSDLKARWDSGDRDPEFLKQYLSTLNATYKADDCNEVAEAILEGKETTFASDPELRSIFMRNISNPFSESFKYVAKTPSVLKDVLGDAVVDAKINNVLSSYQRKLINEEGGTATLDQQKFNDFCELMKELKVEGSDHYRLSTLITCAEKQKDFDSYIKYIKEYLATPGLDANDMQLANWVKPLSDPSTEQKYKEEMKSILRTRLAEIKDGKRKAMTQIGNMRLSRPTDELLEMIINAMDGKMPNR